MKSPPTISDLPRTFRVRAKFGVLAAVLAAASALRGQVVLLTEKEWDGGNSTNWGQVPNWTPNGTPTSTQGALFDALGVGRTTSSLTSNSTVGGIRFGTGATVTYDITGNAGTRRLTLGGSTPYLVQESATSQSISVAQLELGAATVAQLTGAGDLAISSALYGTSSLSKTGAGAGKLILSGNNSNFSGAISINTGTLQAANSNALGTGATTVAGGATLELTGGITVANSISASGSGVGGNGAIRNVAGTNTLSGTITETGATNFRAETGTTLNLTGNLTGTNTTTTFAGAGNINVARITTGTGSVDVATTGTVTFNGGATANTYTGTTTVSSGTLVLAKNSGITAIAGNIVIGDGSGIDTLRLGASNQIADTAGVTINNGGVFNLNGQSETVGGLTSASSGATVSLGAGTLAVAGSGSSTYAGTITGTGGLTKSGSGQLTLSGANTYTGATNISGGTLVLGGSERLANTTAVTVGAGATLNLNNQTETIGSIAGSGSILIGTGQLITGADNTNTSFGGTITGLGELTKTGTGTLVVTSNLGFAGDLTLATGTLQFDADNAFTGDLTISGGTLRLANADLSLANLHVTGNTTIDFAGTGNVLDIASLTIDAGVTITVTNWQNVADYFFAQSFTGGSHVRGVGPSSQIVFNPPTWTGSDTAWLEYNNQITPVPEPSTYGAILMGAGIAFFGWRRWRQAKPANRA